MKLIIKILYFFVVLTFVFSVFSTLNYNVEAKSYEDMMGDAQSFIQAGEEKADVDIDGITSEFVVFGQILTMIGAGVLVAATTYMGIKYFISPPDAQAKLKQQLIGLVVSGVVIFGAYGIWKLVGSIAMSF